MKKIIIFSLFWAIGISAILDVEKWVGHIGYYPPSSYNQKKYLERAILKIPKDENLIIYDDVNNTIDISKLFKERVCYNILNLSNVIEIGLDLSQSDKFRINGKKLEESNIEILDLSNNDLTELPEFVSNLLSLRYLKISKNPFLTKLHESIGNLTKLYTLDLSNNSLTTLPKYIDSLTFIKDLDLSGNNLKKLPVSILDFKDLKALNISNNDIEEFPEFIFNIKSLEILNLSNLGISLVSKSISNLTNLKVLDLSNNSIVTLPESIGNLKILQCLKLSNNNLITVPESIGNLTNHIYEIDISNNNLITVPESFINLRIGDLNLSNNNIEVLPAYVFNSYSVSKLYLSNNNIRTLPESIERSSLIFVDLSYNKIEMLPESVFHPYSGYLTNVWVLDLSFNPLITLPASIVKLGSLRHLNLFQVYDPIIKYFKLDNGKEGYTFVGDKTHLSLEDIKKINRFLNKLSDSYDFISRRLTINPFQSYDSKTESKKYSFIIGGQVKSVLEGKVKDILDGRVKDILEGGHVREEYSFVGDGTHLSSLDIKWINKYLNKIASKKRVLENENHMKMLIINGLKAYYLNKAESQKCSEFNDEKVQDIIKGRFIRECYIKYIKIDLPIDIIKKIAGYL